MSRWQEIHEKYPIPFPEPSLEPVWFGKREKTLMADKKAIVDQRTGNPLGFCTEKYQLVRYEDVLIMVEDVVKALGIPDAQIIPRLLSGGGKMVVSLRVPSSQTEIAKGDAIIPKIEIQTSYDLSWVMQILFGMFQLRCSNGVGTWLGFEKFRKRHIQSLDLTLTSDMISSGLIQLEEQTKIWKEWKGLKVPEDAYIKVWEELPFSSAEKEKIEALPDVTSHLRLPDLRERDSLDMWSMNSILTQFATHHIKSDLRRHEIQPQIARGMDRMYRRLTA